MYNGETVCLFLEVIADQAYEKSRFLRGAPVDRYKIEAGSDDLTPQPEQSARPGWELKWLPPEAVEFDLIDKPIVLDAAQEAVRRHSPPLVLIGPAGSGKTAVTLAKMRVATGNVLSVTLSVYLAQTSRRLYSAHGYESRDDGGLDIIYRTSSAPLAEGQNRPATVAALRPKELEAGSQSPFGIFDHATIHPVCSPAVKPDPRSHGVRKTQLGVS